ncbi:MAG: hypothetical protein V1851_02615 [Patescibacteria group bacterium]
MDLEKKFDKKIIRLKKLLRILIIILFLPIALILMILPAISLVSVFSRSNYVFELILLSTVPILLTPIFIGSVVIKINDYLKGNFSIIEVNFFKSIILINFLLSIIGSLFFYNNVFIENKSFLFGLLLFGTPIIFQIPAIYTINLLISNHKKKIK